jgi:hypothetical protein
MSTMPVDWLCRSSTARASSCWLAFWLSRKVKSRNSVATLTPVSSDSFAPGLHGEKVDHKLLIIEKVWFFNGRAEITFTELM